jgi:hypothetical protein
MDGDVGDVGMNCLNQRFQNILCTSEVIRNKPAEKAQQWNKEKMGVDTHKDEIRLNLN